MVQPSDPGIGVQKTLMSSIQSQDFQESGRLQENILELCIVCNALHEVSRTPQDCEGRCNPKGYRRTSIYRGVDIIEDNLDYRFLDAFICCG